VDHVSIHAPVKGTTNSARNGPATTTCFNPRAREGRDNFVRLLRCYISCFNPRAREGRDIKHSCIFFHDPLFQSTRP